MRSPLPSAWSDFFKAYVGSWSYGLAFLALIALGFAIQRCIKTRSGSILVPLIATFLTLLLTHPFMPVSGPYPVDSAHPHFVPRYITGVFLIGMALTTILLGAQGRTKWIWWACAAVASVAAWSGSAKGLVLTMVAATLLFGLSYFLFYALARSSGLSWRSALVAIGSCVAAALLPYTQQTVDRYVFDGYTDVPVGTGWRALEALPSGSRIAWFDNYKWEYYPMYGRRWQLAPVPVRSDGTSFRPVHYDWRYPPPELSSGPELLKNLLRAGVQYVFVSKNRGDVWPAQYNQLDRLEGVTKVYNDGYSAIFRIS